jgi:hypothetical protein
MHVRCRPFGGSMTNLDTMAAFPKGDHDDDVDSTTQALNWMIGRSDATGLFRYYEDEARKLKQGSPG